ncbi:MAG: NAD+ synthase [Gammaproteobacteria bacterium]|nr:NAD+ synthase [Gammaproteobacteria bacterium]
MAERLRLALAQQNCCVGDIEANTAAIISAVAKARDGLHADLVAFPELAITGYPPEDLLFRPGLHRRVEAALERIMRETRGIRALVGHPEAAPEGLYNSVTLFHAGARVLTYRKQRLPNYAVFDEKRYFIEGRAPAVVDVNGYRIGLGICEDIWDPATSVAARDAGAEFILNVNASPYHTLQRAARLAALRTAGAASGLPIVYLNLVGGQDELVFDGGSLAVAARGDVRAAGPEFEEALLCWEIGRGRDGLEISGAMTEPLTGDENVYAALVLGVRDYVRKNRFKGAVLGLSGGIDSALTLAIAADALGAENVTAIAMPSRYTADMSNEDAALQARALGSSFHVVPIEQPFAAFNDILAPVFAGAAADVTEENIQARCRGIILMAVSNKTGRIVLTTGNKSEMSVGYATLYGDMAGGFAPLKDVPKMLVYRLSRWRNSRGIVIPERVIERPPSAELRPDQKDTDSLPPYEVLDPILEMYIERDLTPQEICAQGYELETVKRVARMVDRNEYKRRQAAPGVRITQRAFGRDRRFPITSGYHEQDPEPA